MTRRDIILTIILFISWPITHCMAGTFTWNGSAGNDWNTPANWSTGFLGLTHSVPTSTDAVQIGVSSIFINSPTVSSTTTISCASVEFGTLGTITLTVNGSLTVNGNIVQDHPSLLQNITT